MDDPAILVIDPGIDKCGIAVLNQSSVLGHTVAPTADLIRLAASWVERHHVEVIAVGDGTGSGQVRRLVMRSFPTVSVVSVEEAGTTLEARRLYFAEHPPRGWRRLVPLSLQLPAAPYDDYAAIVMGRRYLRRVSGKVYGTSREEEESS